LPFFGLESCEHKPLSCACCQRCAIAMALPPTFCPHTPSPARGPIFPGRTCARALTRTRVRSPAYVPNQRRRAVPRRPPFFVPLPSAHHQFRVAAMAVPSAFGTHTNARNRGAEPLLHLSVTVLTFRRAVAANPYAPAHVCPSSHRPQVRTFWPP
jgi:hypothetical protein